VFSTGPSKGLVVKNRHYTHEQVLLCLVATRKLSRSGLRGHFSTILQPITRLLGRQAFHPKENPWQGSNSLFKLSELQTLTASRAQVCEQHTDVADCTRLGESTPWRKSWELDGIHRKKGLSWGTWKPGTVMEICENYV